MNAPATTPLLVLTGTTASGKNRLGVELARRRDGEILSLDSMKVYRGMDIGTDKPSLALRAAVPHHLVDVLAPNEDMNLSRFVARAHEAVAGIRERGKTPIVVGGTALYLKGFLSGVFEGPDADFEFRGRLRTEAAAVGTEALHQRLIEIDPVAAARIHPHDYKRIERALEVHALTGQPISGLQHQWAQPTSFPYRLFILTWERALLDRRINERVDQMFASGFLDEVRTIHEGVGFGRVASQAIGYREVVSHLKGDISLDEAIELTKRGTRRFARRQMTWFRKMAEAVWIEADESEDVAALATRVEHRLTEDATE